MASVRSIFFGLYRSPGHGAQPAELVPVGTPRRTRRDPDARYGSIESGQPGHPHEGNPNAPALDASGWPNDPVAIAEDRIGANEDESEG
jgi:hypothetical protein